ncbi:nitrate reductase molybdenum cofactor assembly chaperone [Shigella flexneri]
MLPYGSINKRCLRRLLRRKICRKKMPMRWHFPARFNGDGSARCPGPDSELFDRGRATSPSAIDMFTVNPVTRGQATADLPAQYEQHGLQLNSRELPDHLPLYLEYLSQLPQSEAVEGLKIFADLALLSARLYSAKAVMP